MIDFDDLQPSPLPTIEEVQPPAMPFPEAQEKRQVPMGGFGDAKYVVFDTENTGLFHYKRDDGSPYPADEDGQPRLASIALITCDAAANEIGREMLYVKPDGWSMPQGMIENSKGEMVPTAGEINGLTDEFLEEHGVPIAQVLDLWEAVIHNGLSVVAHNAQHDSKQMRAELRRAGRDDLFGITKQSCTMRSMKPYKDQGLFPTKHWMVKLTVCCEVFGIKLENPHEAMADAEAAFQLLKILVRDGNLIPPAVYEAGAATGAKK